MTHIACTFTRRLAPVLAPAFLLAALSCREDTESPAAPEAGPTLDVTPTQALAFRQVSAGTWYTCGVTTDDRGEWWGGNVEGQLGDGTTTERRGSETDVSVPPLLLV
jgi:alpha-tubulin suppressor-like RCC1 family protein